MQAPSAPVTRLGPRIVRAFSLRRSLRMLTKPLPAGAFPELDGMRAIGTLLVVSFHLVYLSGPGFRAAVAEVYSVRRFALQAHYFVDMFFVLSGFLIAHLLISEYRTTGGIGIGRFFARRALRLLPVYFVCMLLVHLAGAPHWENAWANVFYVNNYLPFQQQYMLWTWSLAIEEQFYFLLPFAIILLLRHSRARLLHLCVVLGIAVAVRLVICRTLSSALDVGGAHLDSAYEKTHMRFGALVCGVIVAYLHNFTEAVRRASTSRVATVAFLLVAAAALIVMAPAFPSDLRVVNPGPWVPAERRWIAIGLGRYVFASAIAFLILLMLGTSSIGRGARRVLALRIWRGPAQLSYSTYVVHFAVIAVAYRVFFPHPALLATTQILRVAILFAMSYGCALLLYLFVEAPALGFRSAFFPPSDVPRNGGDERG
jgi:peptidoglycan/LPS O-acetylase OafA/YrhL